MKVPFSWLKDYVDIDVTAQELQEKLFSCGFEVEELIYLGKDVEKVVVGRIEKIYKHPNADKLQICVVDCGTHGTLQICTAATNVFEGAKVPVATDGATVLHEGATMKIKAGKMRGEDSQGMLCSGEELGINEDYYPGADVYGILILAEDTPVGEDVRKVVGLDDYLFDIAVTANRPDCQSVLGIAREVAAVLKKPLKLPDFSYTEHPVAAEIRIAVQAPDLCPRYIGHYVSSIRIGQSPAWMRKRLALCGIRSISNIVDITNFVLLEMGQPMHAFDVADIAGGKIVVRRAAEGEKIVTLDEKEFTLTPNNLVICDGEKPVALAGVMGGKNSGIKEGTSAVLFEAAKFARDSVRKTSRALGQKSDSSARFEKGVDEYTTEYGMKRALHLIEELDCGVVSSTHIDIDADPADSKGRPLTVSVNKINALLGITVPTEEMVSILESLQFSVKAEGDALELVAPAYRDDVDGYPDIAEEIIRMYGYDHIHPTFLKAAQITQGGLNDAQKAIGRVKRALRMQGYHEAVNYSFYSPKSFDLLRLPQDAPERKAIRILNPIGEDLSALRTILAPSMIENVVRNVRRGNENGKLYEYANVYLAKSLPLTEQPEERPHIVMGLWGEGDFFDLKGALDAVAAACNVRLTYRADSLPFLHPGATARLWCGEKEVGYIGELAPDIAADLAIEKKVYLAELDYAPLAKKAAAPMRFAPLPKFPVIKRDLALVADESVTCGEVEDVILHACKAVTEVRLFDVYRSEQIGAGKKSMAFTLTFTPEEKAFTPEGVDKFVKKILDSLAFRLKIALR